MPHSDSAELLKTHRSVRKAAWAAAISTFFAMITALGVYSGETERATFQKLRYTSDSYSAYLDYREKKAERIEVMRCINYLIDATKITDKEFVEFFDFSPQYTFTYDPARHRGLRECVDQKGENAATMQALFEQKDKWSEDDFRHLRRALSEGAGSIVTRFDAALIGYPREVIDRIVTCENFAGFLMAGVATTGHGILGKYIQRGKDLKLVRMDNFPNIYEFHEHVSGLTKKFERNEPIDCSRIPRKSRLRKTIETLFGSNLGYL
jgi:hypothetical protein